VTYDWEWLLGKGYTILLLALLFALTGCGEKEQTRRYAMQGEVKSLDAAAGTATISHGKIGDWMGAMTMEYPVKPDAELQKLHVGDRIEATVVVNDLKYYVTDVKVVPKQ
jgi:Cu/Ag efflux protein CusF